MLKKLLFSYKPDQAMVVRGTGLGMLAALYLFGCWGLYHTAFNWFGGNLGKPLASWLIIPLVDQEINGALVATVVVFSGLVLVTARILDKPKTADLLIDTETELQKVTWPSWPETVNASMVVIFTTVFMAVLLFIFDWILRLLTALILFG